MRTPTATEPKAKRRFEPPTRPAVAPAVWRHPIFAALRDYADWLQGEGWPPVAALDAALAGRVHALGGQPLRFVAQDAELLADGRHYETRILADGRIATREDNWHDLFNALAWLRQGELKAALNRRQADDVAAFGIQARSRGQQAMTQFDEAGVIVRIADPALLQAWDRHDWPALFWQAADAWWTGQIEVDVFGHALYEHALCPQMLLVGKCVAVVDRSGDWPRIRRQVADAIAEGRLLNDPQDLRPLPLSGIPGWHAQTGLASFYREAPCFRPLRPGRRYPLPLDLTAGVSKRPPVQSSYSTAITT